MVRARQKRSGRVGMKKHRGLAKCRCVFSPGKASPPPAYAFGRLRARGPLLRNPLPAPWERDVFRIDRLTSKLGGIASSFQEGRGKALRCPGAAEAVGALLFCRIEP